MRRQLKSDSYLLICVRIPPLQLTVTFIRRRSVKNEDLNIRHSSYANVTLNIVPRRLALDREQRDRLEADARSFYYLL